MEAQVNQKSDIKIQWDSMGIFKVVLNKEYQGAYLEQCSCFVAQSCPIHF